MAERNSTETAGTKHRTAKIIGRVLFVSYALLIGGLSSINYNDYDEVQEGKEGALICVGAMVLVALSCYCFNFRRSPGSIFKKILKVILVALVCCVFCITCFALA